MTVHGAALGVGGVGSVMIKVGFCNSFGLVCSTSKPPTTRVPRVVVPRSLISMIGSVKKTNWLKSMMRLPLKGLNAVGARKYGKDCGAVQAPLRYSLQERPICKSFALAAGVGAPLGVVRCELATEI